MNTREYTEDWVDVAASQIGPDYTLSRNFQAPWTPLVTPISDCRVALVTTSAVHHKADEPFAKTTDLGEERPTSFGTRLGYYGAGEYSYHTIWKGTPAADLTVTMSDYDSAAALEDIDCVFPIDRLAELDAMKVIRAVAPRSFSFYGCLSDMGRLEQTSAPEVARLLREDRVDAVLLTPGGPISHQALAVIQRVIEASGIPTVSLTLAPDITHQLQVPRAVFAPTEMGKAVGDPGDVEYQRRVLSFMLDALAYIRKPATIVGFD